jgi:magnesium-transporting ATPase (P-type)
MKIQKLLAATLAATMAASLGHASTVDVYPKYYTELNDDHAGESEDTTNGYPDQKKGTIKTMFQEILLKATSSSTNGTNHATDDRIFSNLFSLFFVLAGCWGDLLIIRICLTCAYIFMLPFQILMNGYKENYAWIALTLYLHGSTVVRLIINEGRVNLDDKQEQVSFLLYCSVSFDYLLSLYSSFFVDNPRCLHIEDRKLYGATFTVLVVFLASCLSRILPSASSSLMRRQERS